MMMRIKDNLPAAIWVIINLVFAIPVFVLFILGVLLTHWSEAYGIVVALHPVLWFHMFYLSLYAGIISAFITTLILAVQIGNVKAKHKPLSAPLVAAEVFIIIVNVLDYTPIFLNVIGQLYYTIPGW
ncbi:hypothetical protein FACS1894133_3040 [Clostridia bacterium]|nr:hypothetical protein FACS1894133_3040 [Clostridia bacterium]